MADEHTADDTTPSRFDNFGGYYSARFSGVEFARFAPSNVWSDYAASMKDVEDFSYAFVATDADVTSPGQPAEKVTPSDEALQAAGFAKRYRLCGHPAYPDPLNIWPPTEENAARIYEQYCAQSFEEYVAALGHTPRRVGGTPYTAETFNPRVLITWEYVDEKCVYSPEAGRP